MWYDRSEGYLYFSEDGETFTERAVPMPDTDDVVDVDVVAVSPDDPLTAWVVVGTYGSDVLLQTTDGGASFVEVFAVEADILSGAVEPDGAVWLAVSGWQFFRAEDGQTFSALSDPPAGRSVTWGDGVAWTATDATYDGYIAYTASADGFSPTMHLSTLQPPPSCAAETHSATFCDPLWEKLQPRLPLPPDGGADSGGGSGPGEGGDSGGTDTGSTDPDCGCGGEAAWVLLPLSLLGLRRRRL